MNHQCSRKLGFTLVELLVVIIIVAVLATAVAFGLSPKNLHRDVDQEANRLSASLQLLAEEATLQGELLGVVFYPHQYEILRWVEPDITAHSIAKFSQLSDGADDISDTQKSKGHWVTAGRESFYQNHHLPIDIDLQVMINDESITLADPEASSNTQMKPVLLLLPSGEITPFSVTFLLKKNPSIEASVRGNEVGEITVDTRDEANQ